LEIKINGIIHSLIIDGVEMIKPKKKLLSDAFLEYLGAKEYTGIVQVIQEWYYGRFVKASWCATSLSYFADACGLSKQIGKHENVDRMKEYMAKNNKIKMSLAYKGNYIPKTGDVVFFSDKHTYNDCTHVGAVLAVDNNMVTWIAGNTSDSIAIRETNMKTDKYLVCFGEVDY
jgi:hypothetical protein